MKQSKTLSNPDVVIVGAGVAGLYMLHKLNSMGLKTVVLEKSDELGGTWNWNRYPGARCDIPSLEYSYQFDEELQQDWNWSEKYSAQPEILEYLNHVADRFELREHINFEEEVLEAKFNEVLSLWDIKTNKELYKSKFCIFATGCLSVPNKPDIEGLEGFEGQLLSTSYWPREEVNLSDKNVAIIGTGSSSIQTIPEIAKEVKNL